MSDTVMAALTLANVLLLCEHEARVKRYKASVSDLKPIWERPGPTVLTCAYSPQGHRTALQRAYATRGILTHRIDPALPPTLQSGVTHPA